jgi:hypothetical protein
VWDETLKTEVTSRCSPGGKWQGQPPRARPFGDFMTLMVAKKRYIGLGP